MYSAIKYGLFHIWLYFFVKKDADAKRYAAEQKALADLYIHTKEAKAKHIEEARKAEAIEKKAEAMKLMEDTAVLELILNSDVLPKIVGATATPLTKVDKITMYGDGNNTKLVGDIVNSSTQILSSIQEATGIDLTSLLAGYASGKLTKQAKNIDDKQ